ncbi:MAG TPA: hypothetical protein VJ731_15315 [Terriglobales bacterium]|nr:hypothetical protein [Terriglobales bacterium]
MRRRAYFFGAFVLVDFNSEWFKLYCDAILASDPEVAHENAKHALACIQTKLLITALSSDERDAMLAARRYLLLMDEIEMPKAS